MRKRVAFFISGKGCLFKTAVACATQLGFIPAVVVLDDKADSTLDAFCQAHGIECCRFDSKHRAEFDAAITEYTLNANPDIISLTFDKIVPSEIIAKFQNRIFNVHMSLLPAFQGFRAIERALDAGVMWLGATIHMASDEVDGGAIIAQCQIPTYPGLDPIHAGKQLFPLLEQAYIQTLAWFSSDRIQITSTNSICVHDAKYECGPVLPSPEPPVLHAIANVHSISRT